MILELRPTPAVLWSHWNSLKSAKKIIQLRYPEIVAFKWAFTREESSLHTTDEGQKNWRKAPGLVA